MGSVNNNGPKVEYKPDPPKPEQKDNATSSTPAGSTPAASTPAPSTPAGSSPVGSTQAVGSTAGSTPVSKPNGNGTTPPIISGPKSDTFTPSNNLFVGSLDTEIPGAKALAAGSTPAGSTPAGSAPAGSSPAGSSPAGSTPAGSTPAGSSPAGSSPAGSTTAGSTPGGSTPTGTTTVLVIDNGQNPITNYGETHMSLVSGTVKKYAPDVKIATFDLGGQISTGEDGLPAVKATGPEGVDKWIDSYAQIPEGQIDILKAGLEENPDAKVINTSFGASRRQVYDDIYTSIINPDNADADKLGLKLGLDQKTIDGLQKEYLEYKGSGSDPDSTRFKSLSDTTYSKAVQDGISAYVDAKMDDPNGTFQKGLKKYQDYTKELSEKGVTVVTSYGNDGGGASWTYNQYKTGSEDQTVNFNAMSDYVISVAASTTNGPDGKPTDFSSYGGGKWKPTISADGEDVAGIDGKVDGTSFSAPTVAGTIGEMLVKNPNLKFTDIKKNLQTNAYDTSADEYKEGAGILNYEKSIANAGSTPAGSTPAGSTPAGSSPAGSSPAGSSPAGSSPAGSSPAGSSPAGSSPAGSSPAGSSPAGSSPAGSSPAGSSPAGSTPTGSTPANDVGSTPAGSTPAGSSPAGSSPAGSSPAGSTPAGSSPAGSTPAGSTPVGSNPYVTAEMDKETAKYFIDNFNRISKGDGSVSGDDLLDLMNPNGDVKDFTYSAYLAMGNPGLRDKLNSYDGNSSNGFTMNDLNAVYSGTTASSPAGSTPAGSTPAGSSPAGSSPAGSSPAGSSPAGSSPAGSSPAGSTPTGSTPANDVGSTPAGSTPAGSSPAGSSPAGSSPAGSTPAASTPAGSSPAGSSPAGSSPAGSTPVASTPVGSSPAGSSPAGSTPAGSTPVGSTPTASTYTLDQAFFDFGRDPNAAKDNNGKYLTTDFKGGYFGTTQGQADLGRIDALDGNADGKIDKTYVTGLSDANSSIYKSYVEFDPTKASAKANKDILNDKNLFDKLDGNDTIIYGNEIDTALKSGDYTAEEKIRLAYLKNAKQSGGGTLWDAIAGGNTFNSNVGGIFDTKNREDLAKLDWDPAKVSMNSATTPTDQESFFKALDTHKDAKGNINYQTLLTDTTDPTLVGLRNFKVGNTSAIDLLKTLDEKAHGGTARGFIDSETAAFLQKNGQNGYNYLTAGDGFSWLSSDGSAKDLNQSFLPYISEFKIPTTKTGTTDDGILQVDDIKAYVTEALKDPDLSLPERQALNLLDEKGTNGRTIIEQWEKYVNEPGRGRTGTTAEWQAFLATLAPTG